MLKYINLKGYYFVKGSYMNIDFKNNKLRKCCNEWASGVKEWGQQIATKVFQRLVELRAATNLSEISHLPPPRCHMVDGIRKDCWAVDTVHRSDYYSKLIKSLCQN